MKLVVGAFATAALTMAMSSATWAQDAKKGETVFSQCQACHSLEKAMVGPALRGVVGRKAGSSEGYSYSPLMKAAGDAGLTWSEATLVDYLKDPTAYLKKFVADKGKEANGTSKMVFKLSGEPQRKDVVAYLAGQK